MTAPISVSSGTVIINGLDASGDSTSKLFTIANNATVILNGANLTQADPTFGAISNAGNLTLNDAVFAGDYATEYGGAIYNTGNLIFSDSVFTDDSAGMGGGAIYNDGGNVVGINSTFAADSANFGGAIANEAGNVSLTNCTISGNTAVAGPGGGIDNSGNLNLQNTIVAANTASTTGPDLDNAGGNVGASYSLIGDTTNSTITTATGAGNILGPSYLGLGPVGNYGGPTQTIPLLPGSPAIDAGSNDLALDSLGNPLSTDQRRAARIVNGTVDIGAFESQGFSLNIASGDNQSTFAFAALVVNVTANNSVEPVEGGQLTFIVMSAANGAAATLSSATDLIANGQASVVPTANSVGGSYTVTASGSGVAIPATFQLTNSPTTVSWTGAAEDGNWDTPGNWSTGSVPNQGDAVTINAPTSSITKAAANIDAVYSLTDNAALVVSGGSLSVFTTSTIENNLTLQDGSFGGPGAITVSGMFTWSGGTLSGTAGTGSLVANGMILSANTMPLDGYSLVNPQGQTATLTGNLYLYQGATFDNEGSLVLGNTGGMWRGSGDTSAVLLLNNGSISKPSGTGEARLLLPIDSNGPITLGAGALDIGDHYGSAPSTYNDAVTGVTGTLFYLTGGSSVSTFVGDFSADQVDFYDAATYQFQGDYSSNSSITNGVVTMTGAVADLGQLIVAGGSTTVTGLQPHAAIQEVDGTLDLSAVTLAPGDTTLSSLILGGTLISGQDFTIMGLFQWTGGTLEHVGGGLGSVLADGGMLLSGNTMSQDGYSLVNPQGQTATLTGNLYLYQGVTFDNEGSLILGNTGVMWRGGGDTSAVLLLNNGSISKPAGTGEAGLLLPIDSNGPITLGAGRWTWGTITAARPAPTTVL